MTRWFCLLLLCLFGACRTTLEFTAPNFDAADGGASSPSDSAGLRIRIVRTPIYIVADSPQFAELVAGEARKSGDSADTVARRIEEGTTEPNDEFARWDGVILEYDYDPGIIYHVYGSPFRITAIELEPGETLSGQIIIGDSARWMIESGRAKDQTHIYLKPTTTNLETSMIINTDKRRYYLVVRSYNQKYMVGVRWRYPLAELAEAYENVGASSGRSLSGPPASGLASTGPPSTGDAPPLLGHRRYNLYSFDYELKYPARLEVSWLPERVYDDGEKTYIELSGAALNFELPVIHLGKRKKKELVNYRIRDTTLVLDKLIKTVTMHLAGDWVVVNKEENDNG